METVESNGVESRELIDHQRQLLLQTFKKVVPANTPYSVLEFPDHANVGDSAIWLGEMSLLREVTGRQPAAVACQSGYFDFDRLDRALPEGPILLHGGGNFGDIWPWCQEFRETILQRYKGRQVIQLPQSLSFSSESAVEQCARLISAHGNFHIMTRDPKSEAFARSRFDCPVHLTPDAAFGIGPLRKPFSAEHAVFMLLRADRERVDFDRSPFDALDDVETNDWIEDPENLKQNIRRQAAVRAALTGAWPRERRRYVYYHQLAEKRLQHGIRLLCSGRRVVTDRLHAHIISVLLDIPHVAMDNNYGKISSYIKAWTGRGKRVRLAGDAAEAVRLLKELPEV